MAVYIGLDVGTTSLSTVALESTEGRLVAQANIPNTASHTYLGPQGHLYAELDLSTLKEAVIHLLRTIKSQLAPDVIPCAIGVTGQQHGLALLSYDLIPLGPAITWQDQRALERIEEEGQKTFLDAMIQRAGGPAAFERMGCLPATGFMGATLFWLAIHHRLPLQPAYACFIPDAIVAMLTQTPPCSDPTNAGSAGVFDIVSNMWAWEVIDRLGLPRGLFPPIRPAGEIHSTLTPEHVRATGLGEIPVCVAMGDNQASFVGSVRDPENSVLVNIGTGGQVSVVIPHFGRLPIIETRAFPGSGFLLVGAELYGGRAYDYLQMFFQQVGRVFWGVDATELYEKMNALAAHIPPGAEGVRCEPFFMGTRADPSQRASFTGLDPTNMTPAHFVRALLEGLAEGFYTLYQAMHPLAGERAFLIGAGNALVQNPVLGEIIARRFGKDLHLATHTESAALGAALMATIGMGEKSFYEASSLVTYDRVIPVPQS